MSTFASKNIKNNLRNFRLSLLILIIILISTEIVLRFSGFVLTMPSESKNKILSDDANKFKILALGESTTADYFSAKSLGSWPRLLEEKLRQAGVNARVYNEGLGGTSSAMILSKLPSYLDHYQPDLVISMMGINDSSSLHYDDSILYHLNSKISQLRILKLLKWIFEATESSSTCKIIYDIPNVGKFIDHGLNLAQTQSVLEVENALRVDLKNDPEMAITLAIIAMKLRGDFSDRDKQLKAAPFADRAFELYPYYFDVAFQQLQAIGIRSGPLDLCLKVSKKLLPCGNNLPDNLLSAIAMCSRSSPEIANNPLFKSRGLTVTNNQDLPTAHHYRLLYTMLSKRNISLIAMQYPTVPIEKLKTYFTDATGQIKPEYSQIIFVSNNENFQQALLNHKFEEVFRDRFKGTWGHTTELGYELIVDSVMPAVLEKAGSFRN
jgi:hypothetical protein